MLKDITFGQYYPTSSFIHRLDPRLKILLLIILIVFLFIANNYLSLSLAIVFIFTAVFSSKVPVKMYLKNLKAILPIIIFTFIINLFYDDSGSVLISFWKISITSVGLSRSVFLATRIFMLIISSSILTYTTLPNDLTDAIERLLSPLRFIGLKNIVHTLAMMMTITLRFIPTLIEETEKTINAQKARGVDFENGKFTERIKALIPILIPLLISSIRRAYELAEAMECRCYNGCEGRVRMKQLHLCSKDYISAFISIAFCVLIVFMNAFCKNNFAGLMI